MMQDILQKLTTQNCPTFEVFYVGILSQYAQICNWTHDFENALESCKKGISITAPWNEKYRGNFGFYFHVNLGHAYINLSNGPEAEKAMRDARSSMPHFSALRENSRDSMAPDMEIERDIDPRAMAAIEGRSFHLLEDRPRHKSL